MNKQKYLQLQNQYINDRSNQQALGEMMLMIMELAYKLTNKYVTKHKIVMSKEDKEDINVATMERFLIRYKTKSDWMIEHNPIGSIYFDWFKTITGNNNVATLRQRQENNCLSWDSILDELR